MLVNDLLMDVIIKCYLNIYIYSTFTFSHLADGFYPKRLTNEDNGSNQNQLEQ